MVSAGALLLKTGLPYILAERPLYARGCFLSVMTGKKQGRVGMVPARRALHDSARAFLPVSGVIRIQAKRGRLPRDIPRRHPALSPQVHSVFDPPGSGIVSQARRGRGGGHRKCYRAALMLIRWNAIFSGAAVRNRIRSG